MTELAQVSPVPEYDMEALASQAVAFMLPSVNEGLSILNFAYELRELKSMDPRDSIRRVRYGATSLKLLSDPKTREGFVKDTTRRLASAHLQAEFGIIPFVRDVVDLWDELNTIDQKIKRIKAHANRPQIRHYKRVLPYEAGKFWPKAHRETKWSTINGGVLPNISGDPWVHFFWGANGSRETQLGFQSKALLAKQWILRPTYHATMRYSYKLPRFETEWGEKLALYTEALGVRLDPTIPWNAARLSFLVDWVVDVSGFLSRFARENYPLEYTVLDFCHSLKWHSESTIDITIAQGGTLSGSYQNPFPAGWNKSAPIQAYRSVESYYERRRFNPPSSQLASKRGTWRKAALAGSLVITNSRFLRKGRGHYLRLLPQTLRDLHNTTTKK
jgi:hypothetical protein